MKKDKKQLLWMIIFMIIYVIINIIYLSLNGGIINKDKIDSLSNILVLSLSAVGIIYLIIIFNKDLNKHYKGILIWSIIFFICNLISGILGFIIYSNLDKVKKEKRDLPVIKRKDYKNKYLCLVGLIFCLILMFFVSNYLKGYQIIIEYALIFITMIYLFKDELIHDFKIFIEYFREYNSLVLKHWFKSLVTLMILSIIISLVTGLNTATNQENLNEMFNNLPILVGILTIIYAPIVEELMFRGVFRKFINNKYLFIIISGVVFGLLHVIDDFQSTGELLYIIVYSSLGMYLASLYYKTNNICTNIYFHMLQNTLGVIGMILLNFLR